MRVWSYLILVLASIIAVGIYMIPTYVAFKRHHPSRWGIAVVNVFLGATVFGWIGAMLWSTSEGSKEYK